LPVPRYPGPIYSPRRIPADTPIHQPGCVLAGPVPRPSPSRTFLAAAGPDRVERLDRRIVDRGALGLCEKRARFDIRAVGSIDPLLVTALVRLRVSARKLSRQDG